MNQLEKNILKTLIYFDLVKKPLTDKEIWRNLWGITTSFPNLQKSLKSLLKQGKIENRDGIHCLKGHQNLIKVGEKKQQISQKFWQKTFKILKILQLIPFIKMIAVVGSLSQENVTKSSDIDLIVFTDTCHLRLARDIVIFLLTISGKLTKKHKAENFGPDYFVTPKTCNFEFLAFRNSGFRQMYWVYWVAFLTPIYENGPVYRQFKKQNLWLKKYLPNFQWPGKKSTINNPAYAKASAGRQQSTIKKLLERFFKTKIGQIIEKKLAQKQKERLERFKQKISSDLVINSDERIFQFSTLATKWQKLEKKFTNLLTRHNLI